MRAILKKKFKMIMVTKLADITDFHLYKLIGNNILYQCVKCEYGTNLIAMLHNGICCINIILKQRNKPDLLHRMIISSHHLTVSSHHTDI